MEGGWLARMRWRRSGAWLLPAFLTATVIDAVIGHLLPPSGETQTILAAVLAGWFLNLFAVLILTLPFSAIVRRARPDMPKVVARDYAGTTAVALVTAALLTIGLTHHPQIIAHKEA